MDACEVLASHARGRPRQGVYPLDDRHPLPPDLLRRHFQRGVGPRAGTCRVKAELRDRVRFQRLNLFQPDYPVPRDQHVIFCRNVMIYFDPPSREVLVGNFARHLAPGGYLVIGHSESLLRRPPFPRAGPPKRLPPAMKPSRKIRVLIVDDSAVARRAIRDTLNQDPGIEVVDVAGDAYVAREKILALDPDVITLDLEMPRMDGLTFLRILQQHHPVPVVVVSSLTPQGSAKALEALAAGAVDVLAKPDGCQTLGESAQHLAECVKAAACVRRRPAGPPTATPPPPPTPTSLPECSFPPRRLLLIGSSTGGVEALRFLLPRLPANVPPIAVVQHIPPTFSRIMAEHLNKLCPFEVREAADGDPLRPGLCLVAPGDFHLALVAHGNGYRARLTQSPPVHHCRPAVDILFRSAAECAGPQAVAVLLTGMGADGARGLQTLRHTGARTLVEHEESCVVFGMPQAAIKLGAAEEIVPLPRMPQAILHALTQPART